MIVKQQVLRLSEYSSLYDLIDFNFIYEELRPSILKPKIALQNALLKYLLLKVIYTISGVDVIERSRYDMSF
mgnify:CR=1 FL=1